MRLGIESLRPGMFVEAAVRSTRIDGETRHFLDMAAGTAKKLRLKNGRHEQILHAGGMLLTSDKQIAALRDAGLSAVVVDTDKSDATPGLRALLTGATQALELVGRIGPELVDGAGGRIEWDFLAGLAGEPPYAQLRRALAAERLDAVLDEAVWVRAVAPRQDLAHYVPGAGYRKADAADLLKPGVNVRLINGRYQAEIHGYVHLGGGELSVLPPLWLSPDRMEAHFVSFPQYGEIVEPTRESVAAALEAAGVCRGWREKQVIELLAGGPTERTEATLVACGLMPERGTDSEVRYHFTPASAAAEGGDLRQRGEGAQVKSGQLLAEVRDAGAGTPGADLMGGALAADAGAAAALRPGENVHCIAQEDLRVFYSLIDGSARVAGDELRVYPLVHVERDLSGPLDLSESPQDVFVQGSLRAGAELKAAGSVMVEGSVQGGALLQAREDVAIAGGVVGHGTKVVAGGAVEAGYVQHGMVSARGDVVVASHLVNANVRAGGALQVAGAGGIVGGQAWANDGIEAQRVGSANGERTALGILSGGAASARLKELERTIEFCQKNIVRIFRVLKVNGAEPAHFKALMARAAAGERRTLCRLLQKLKQLSATWEKTLAARCDLEQERAQALDAVQVRVAGAVHAGVRLLMGGHKLDLVEDVREPVFTWTREGIELKLAS